MRNRGYLVLALALVLCTSGANAENSQAVESGVALTYDNGALTDGAGSQLIRIYGIYALSRYLHLPYVHTPLKVIGYQGLTAMEKNAPSANFQDRFNRIFSIPSDIELPPDTVTRSMGAPTREDLENLKKTAQKEHKFYLARILLPFSILNNDTEAYRCLKAISPFKPVRSNIFRIAIHVRRGEELAIESQRMLPNSYYVAAAMRIVDALKRLDIPYVCDLYTEVASKAFVVTNQSHGVYGRLAHPVVIDPKMNRIEDFDVIPHLHKRINGDPIAAMKGMATADALIISRSSFSYFPALLGQNIVVYNHFEGAPLKEWLIADNSGNFSSAQLLEQLKAWTRQH